MARLYIHIQMLSSVCRSIQLIAIVEGFNTSKKIIAHQGPQSSFIPLKTCSNHIHNTANTSKTMSPPQRPHLPMDSWIVGRLLFSDIILCSILNWSITLSVNRLLTCMQFLGVCMMGQSLICHQLPRLVFPRGLPKALQQGRLHQSETCTTLHSA